MTDVIGSMRLRIEDVEGPISFKPWKNVVIAIAVLTMAISIGQIHDW